MANSLGLILFELNIYTNTLIETFLSNRNGPRYIVDTAIYKEIEPEGYLEVRIAFLTDYIKENFRDLDILTRLYNNRRHTELVKYSVNIATELNSHLKQAFAKLLPDNFAELLVAQGLDLTETEVSISPEVLLSPYDTFDHVLLSPYDTFDPVHKRLCSTIAICYAVKTEHYSTAPRLKL